MFAQSLTSDNQDAEDLFQETIYKALKYRDKYTNETNLRAWMFTIMKNTFINAYRRKSKLWSYMESVNHNQHLEFSGALNGNTPSSSQNEKEILSAIDQLEDPLKIPFQRYIDGFKYKEIAKEMGLPIGTVKSRIFNARKILSEQLADFRYA